MLERLLTVVGLKLLTEFGEALFREDEEALKAASLKMLRKVKRAAVKQVRGG